MLITESYRAQQATMHAAGDYGFMSAMYAPMIANEIEARRPKKVLDYGAGSNLTLIKSIVDRNLCRVQFTYVPYEPAVAKWAGAPEPAEMVVCIDVLEHIEPDCLEDVLDDLKRVTIGVGLYTVATIPASRSLPDGRNAHLILQPVRWWLPKFCERFHVERVQMNSGGFSIVVKAI